MASVWKKTLVCGETRSPQKRHHAEREGDVGRDGDGPAARLPAGKDVHREVDEGGHADAAHRGEHRQGRLPGAAQLADGHLVLELDPHEQEEHRHEEVVDELLHGERHREPAHAHGERQLEHVLDPLVERGVGHHEGEKGGEHHDRRGKGAARGEARERAASLEAAHHGGLVEDRDGARHLWSPPSARRSVRST